MTTMQHLRIPKHLIPKLDRLAAKRGREGKYRWCVEARYILEQHLDIVEKIEAAEG